jgi:hypothetical protein
MYESSVFHSPSGIRNSYIVEFFLVYDRKKLWLSFLTVYATIYTTILLLVVVVVYATVQSWFFGGEGEGG